MIQNPYGITHFLRIRLTEAIRTEGSSESILDSLLAAVRKAPHLPALACCAELPALGVPLPDFGENLLEYAVERQIRPER